MGRVTLTFDNGPDEEATPLVLDALRRAEVRSTFFVVGSRVARDGLELVRRAADEGHAIGNHTWTHSGPLGEMSGRAAVAEIVRTQEILGALAGSPPLFRPVGGGEGGIVDRRLLRAESVDHLTEYGYTMVLWNVVPRDWMDPEGWVDTAMARVARSEHACVVLHDAHAVKLLDPFLDRLRDAGAEFVQEAPPECTPIRAGRPVHDLSGIVG